MEEGRLATCAWKAEGQDLTPLESAGKWAEIVGVGAP